MTKLLFVSLLASLCSATVCVAASDESDSALVESGRVRFVADCGFCHGREAEGGSRGLDLTRSPLVAEDVEGNLISEVVRRGRIDKGMPAFATYDDNDMRALAAFIHNRKLLADSAEGGRRSVEPEDLAGGSATAGERYFAANCSTCHSATGDLAGLATRLQGLPLIRRMLMPGSEGPGAARKPPQVQVTLPGGERSNGALAYLDEFTVALIEPDGRYRSWATDTVTYVVDDPREAHVAQLARYTDADMHDVLAYLQTLR